MWLETLSLSELRIWLQKLLHPPIWIFLIAKNFFSLLVSSRVNSEVILYYPGKNLHCFKIYISSSLKANIDKYCSKCISLFQLLVKILHLIGIYFLKDCTGQIHVCYVLSRLVNEGLVNIAVCVSLVMCSSAELLHIRNWPGW